MNRLTELFPFLLHSVWCADFHFCFHTQQNADTRIRATRERQRTQPIPLLIPCERGYTSGGAGAIFNYTSTSRAVSYQCSHCSWMQNSAFPHLPSSWDSPPLSLCLFSIICFVTNSNAMRGFPSRLSAIVWLHTINRNTLIACMCVVRENCSIRSLVHFRLFFHLFYCNFYRLILRYIRLITNCGCVRRPPPTINGQQRKK